MDSLYNWDHVKIGILQKLISELIFLATNTAANMPSLSSCTFLNGDGTAIVDNLRRLSLYVNNLPTTSGAILSGNDLQILEQLRQGTDADDLPIRFHNAFGHLASDAAELFTLLLSVVDGAFTDPTPAAHTRFASLSFPHVLLHIADLHRHFGFRSFGHPSPSISPYDRYTTLAALAPMITEQRFILSSPVSSAPKGYNFRHNTIHNTVNYTTPQLSDDIRLPASPPDSNYRSHARNSKSIESNAEYLELRRQYSHLEQELNDNNRKYSHLEQELNKIYKARSRHTFLADDPNDSDPDVPVIIDHAQATDDASRYNNNNNYQTDHTYTTNTGKLTYRNFTEFYQILVKFSIF